MEHLGTESCGGEKAAFRLLPGICDQDAGLQETDDAVRVATE